MFMDNPEPILVAAGAAFVLGWIVSKVGTLVRDAVHARKRDPRDDRIRSLEADHRVAKSDSEILRNQVEERDGEIAELKAALAVSVDKFNKQQGKVSQLRKDLKDSVKKTRELRGELTDRAAEGVRSEVKLREVETELSVAQASTDMIATGVLDYSLAPGNDDDGDESQETAEAGT